MIRKTYDNICKIETGQGDDYITGFTYCACGPFTKKQRKYTKV